MTLMRCDLHGIWFSIACEECAKIPQLTQALESHDIFGWATRAAELELQCDRLREEKRELVEALKKQTDYLAAVDGLLRTLVIPSEHLFHGARQYSEVLTDVKGGMAYSAAEARSLLRELGGK